MELRPCAHRVLPQRHDAWYDCSLPAARMERRHGAFVQLSPQRAAKGAHNNSRLVRLWVKAVVGGR